MSQVMQYHGCRSLMKDSSKVTGLEDKFDMLVDSNDVILERVVSKLFLNALIKCLVASSFLSHCKNFSGSAFQVVTISSIWCIPFLF